MIEAFCDRDANGDPLTRWKVCERCRLTVITEENVEATLIRPYQQWRIFSWVGRLIAAWNSQAPGENRGQLIADSFENALPDGWVPVFCPACESKDLGADTVVPRSKRATVVTGVDPDEAPPPQAWQLL